MDREYSIDVEEGKKVYGILHGQIGTALVIFVHGLTSTEQEPKYYVGARELYKYGIASYRYAQYSWHEDARKLDGCSIQSLAEDLDVIVAHFRQQGVQNITLIGHSLGAPIILSSNDKDFEQFVFWDGSYDLSRWTDYEYLPERNAYLYDGGARCLLAPDMVDEMKKGSYEEQIERMSKPGLFVYAASGVLVEGGKWYHAQLQSADKKLVYIDGAGHNFEEEGKTEELLNETISWLVPLLQL